MSLCESTTKLQGKHACERTWSGRGGTVEGLLQRVRMDPSLKINHLLGVLLVCLSRQLFRHGSKLIQTGRSTRLSKLTRFKINVVFHVLVFVVQYISYCNILLDVLIGRSPAKKAPPFICSRILWFIFPSIYFDFEFLKMLKIWNFGNSSDEYFYDRL